MKDKIIIGNKEFKLGERTYIMGILNITPDSFSDGGRFNNIDSALSRVETMINDGADIIDIGGESTRPNYTLISDEEEINRIIPVIEAINSRFDIPISVDTYKGHVAEAAIKAGASLINDIWGLKNDKYIAEVASKYNVTCCLMHNRHNKNYNIFIEDVIVDLKESINIAFKAGIKPENIILDPGVGFAKNQEQNIEVINEIASIKMLGYPLLLGTSRKSMIGNILNLPVDERLEGTIATSVIGIMKGCDFIRVHDVLENKRASVVTDAIVRREK